MDPLPDHILRVHLLPYLSNDDQMQLLNCSTGFRFVKIDFRQIIVTQFDLLPRYLQEYSARLFSLINNPAMQLTLKLNDLMGWKYREFAYPKVFRLEVGDLTILPQIFPDLSQDIQIDTLHVLIEEYISQSQIGYLIRMCEVNSIRHLSIESHDESYYQKIIPYFPNVKALTLRSLKHGASLPELYLSHLEKIVVAKCDGIDVSCLGGIPDLTITDCSFVKGVSFLNNRRIKMSYVYVERESLQVSFCNSEQIYLRFCPLNLDLSGCLKVRELELSMYSTRFRFNNVNLPKSVRRCRLETVKGLNWAPFTSQLTELNLAFDDSITTLEGYGLQNIPVIVLKCLSSLVSLQGLGGRESKNRKITVESCDNINDFSPLRSIEIVSVQNCIGFYDASQLDEVRELTIAGYNEELLNLSCLGERTKVLKLCVPFSCFDYSDISTIPHLIIEDVGLDLSSLLSYLAKGGKLQNEVITFYTDASYQLQGLYESYLSSSYQYYTNDDSRTTLIRKM